MLFRSGHTLLHPVWFRPHSWRVLVCLVSGTVGSGEGPGWSEGVQVRPHRVCDTLLHWSRWIANNRHRVLRYCRFGSSNLTQHFFPTRPHLKRSLLVFVLSSLCTAQVRRSGDSLATTSTGVFSKCALHNYSIWGFPCEMHAAIADLGIPLRQ